MRSRSSSTLRAALASLAAIAFLTQTGCDKEDQAQDATAIRKLSDLDSANRKKAGEKNLKEKDLSDAAVQNKALEAIKKNQEKILESYTKAEKEGESSKKKQNKAKKKNADDMSAPQTFVKGNTPFVEIPQKLEKGQTSLSIPKNNKTSNLAEVLGPNNPDRVSTGNTVNFDNSDKKRKDYSGLDVTVMQGNGSTEIGDTARKEDKPGFLDKIFGGNKKPETQVIKQADAGSQFEITNDRAKPKKVNHVFNEKNDGTAFTAIAPSTQRELNDKYNPNHRVEPLPFRPAATNHHGMLKDAVQAEMAGAALTNQALKRELKAEQGADAVVIPLDPSGKRHPLTDFDPPPAKPVPGQPAPVVTDSNTPPAPAKPGDDPKASASEAAKAEDLKKQIERQFGTLEEYRRGLESRDLVARERAFQRAVIEKRDDAVPYLVEEVTRPGSLAEYAAQCLAAMKKRTEPVERAIIAGLSTTASKDSALREACSAAAGDLRLARAVPQLIEKAKRDNNYTVRANCVTSLGQIGDRAALTTLHMKIDDRTENELVKLSAAVALAAFNDPAGREHLIRALDSQVPAMQVIGIVGLAQLNDPDIPGLLISRLDSEYPEIWTQAITLLPRLGAPLAIPMLRTQLLSGTETLRTRAALALGQFGNVEGMPLICRAARNGTLQERMFGCELLGTLQRSDQIPLLIEKLEDPHTMVRQTAAVALTRMNAVQAAQPIAEAARGRLHNQQLPPALRGAQSDMTERVLMLACLRILRGEKEDLALYSLPSARDQRWPEFDRELLKQQQEMLKNYKVVDVIAAGASGAGAMIQAPGGPEILYRQNEVVAAGFKVVDINLGGKSPADNKVIPPFVTLQRGNNVITLYVGQSAEMSVQLDQ